MAVASFVMTSETLEVLRQRSIQSDMGFPKKLKGVALRSLTRCLQLRRAHTKEMCGCGFLFWNKLQSTSETHRVSKGIGLDRDHHLGQETTEPAPNEKSPLELELLQAGSWLRKLFYVKNGQPSTG